MTKKEFEVADTSHKHGIHVKDQPEKEQPADPKKIDPSENVLSAPANQPPVPVLVPKLNEIVAAIKASGPHFSAADRNQLILAVAQLPPVEKSEQPAGPYDGAKEFMFQVNWSTHEARIKAKNPQEAWAMFCDSIKQHPSPKAGKVKLLGEAGQDEDGEDLEGQAKAKEIGAAIRKGEEGGVADTSHQRKGEARAS